MTAIALAVVFTTVAAPALQAQVGTPTQTLPPAAIPRLEAAELAQGWTLLAAAKYDEAYRVARRVLGTFPRNVSALALAVECDIALAGATTALNDYESWLGSRTNEEPGVLRRIARAYLYEWSRQSSDAAARAEALRALDGDGDEQARAAVAAGAAGEKPDDPRRIETLVRRMQAASGSKVREIQALGATGNPRAAESLMLLLTDPLPENRAAAAEALGSIRYLPAAPHLKPLLADPRGLVRIAAAGALFQLSDMSGLSVLQDLAGSEHASLRRTAARLMASQPDETWKALVRGLAHDSDPAIRLEAARLLAPHDPALAREVLSSLERDPNLAIREEAAAALVEAPISGLTDLRRLLRTAPPRAGVRAAARILALTR